MYAAGLMRHHGNGQAHIISDSGGSSSLKVIQYLCQPISFVSWRECQISNSAQRPGLGGAHTMQPVYIKLCQITMQPTYW